MNIGPIRLDTPAVLAPLAGITDLPFRLMVKSFGCGLVYSEMISANGLIYGSAKTEGMLAGDPAEKPLTIQLFGADPRIMARAARKTADAGADIIDINFGCSVKKVVKTGAGAALMRDLERAGAVIEAVRQAVSRPLTIKFRSGWDQSGDDALRLAEIAQARGVEALALHPRTAAQGFSGRADWGLIARLKSQSDLPVIGNGDITSPAEARRVMEETGCDAVMIGRAAIGNPWIFRQIADDLAGRPPFQPGLDDRFEVMRRYLRAAVAHKGEALACRVMRSRLGWFVKGLPHSAWFREAIKQLADQASAEQLLDQYQQFLRERSNR
ncbi:MAG: tRNA dihydrouridine synthase DusB [Desulfosudaceae bacterium]